MTQPPPPDPSKQHLAAVSVHILAAACVLGALATLGVFWFPLTLAAWAAALARPLYHRLSQAMGGRGRSASVVTVLLVVLVLSPIVVILLTLTGDAVDLFAKLQQSPSVAGALRALASESSSMGATTQPGVGLTDLAKDPARLLELVRQHGEGALGIAGRVLGVTVSVLLGLVVFVVGFYNNLTHGREIRNWLLDNSPLPAFASVRMIGAFQETGRGLLVAVGLTALVQGAVASIGYLVVGVPHGLVLGLITALAALVPSVGTGLVWVPVAVGLAIAGRSGGAIAIFVVGMLVSSVDNILRPWLSRIGNLQLPAFVLFLSLLGGMVAFGSLGVLLGPLLVRLAVEATALSREQREQTASNLCISPDSHE